MKYLTRLRCRLLCLCVGCFIMHPQIVFASPTKGACYDLVTEGGAVGQTYEVTGVRPVAVDSVNINHFGKVELHKIHADEKCVYLVEFVVPYANALAVPEGQTVDGFRNWKVKVEQTDPIFLVGEIPHMNTKIIGVWKEDGSVQQEGKAVGSKTLFFRWTAVCTDNAWPDCH